MSEPEKNSDLLEQRVQASIASNGTSTSAVVEYAHQLLTQCGTHKSVLEYGAGRGDLIRRMLDAGWQGAITGADLFPRPPELPPQVSWIQGDLNLPLALQEHSFDVIVSTEVIEHLENPRAVAREFARLLRPNGQIILTTPNQESIRSILSLLVTGHFALFQDSCYPAHITALLRKDLSRIFQESRFKNIAFSYVRHGGIPKCPSVSWQQVSLGLLRGCRFSDTVVMTAQAQ